EQVLPIRSLQMLARPVGAVVRRATADDFPAIRECYRRVAPTMPGWLDRPDVWWQRILVERGDEVHTYVVDGEGGGGGSGPVAGYIRYRQQPDPNRSF